MNILLPVVAILAFAGEWSQRSVMTTLGALLQNSAAAMAVSFALPATVALLGTAWSSLYWIDMATAWKWILDNDWAGHVPQISVSVVFWVAVPLAAGVVRTLRRDVG